jgi:hypothetical protein
MLNSNQFNSNSMPLPNSGIPEESNPSLVLQRLVSQLLIKNGWPLCLCSTNCTCSIPLLPDWATKYGKVHCLLKCLDITNEEFIYTDDFVSGMKSSRSLSVRGGKGKEVLAWITLIYKEDPFPKSLAHQDELEIASGIGKKGIHLRDHASGFACGNVLSDMFTRWNYLRMHCRSEESRFVELKLWIDELSKNIQRMEIVQKWLKWGESKKNQPLQYEIWSGVIFWHLQHALFLIHDLRILTEMKIEEAYGHLDAGLLLWQIGWLQTDSQVCEEVSKIMFMDNESV